jgi:hypothetical protein
MNAAILSGGDAGQVVADAHVEHVWTGISDVLRDRFPAPQHVDRHPRLDVLLERLVDLQLLGPLDVVADGLHVDARPADLQLVEDLDGLQLEHPGTGQPGEDDVLGHLRVWTGGWSERCGSRATEEAHRQVDIGFRRPEAGDGEVEDAVTRLPLVGDPSQQHTSGNGVSGGAFMGSSSQSGVQPGGLFGGASP